MAGYAHFINIRQSNNIPIEILVSDIHEHLLAVVDVAVEIDLLLEGEKALDLLVGQEGAVVLVLVAPLQQFYCLAHQNYVVAHQDYGIVVLLADEPVVFLVKGEAVVLDVL